MVEDGGKDDEDETEGEDEGEGDECFETGHGERVSSVSTD